MNSYLIYMTIILKYVKTSNSEDVDCEVFLCGLFIQKFDLSTIKSPDYFKKMKLTGFYLDDMIGEKNVSDVYFKTKEDKNYFCGIIDHQTYNLLHKPTKEEWYLRYNLFLDKDQTKKSTATFFIGEIYQSPGYRRRFGIIINDIIYYHSYEFDPSVDQKTFINSFLNSTRPYDIVVYECICVDVSSMKKYRGSKVICKTRYGHCLDNDVKEYNESSYLEYYVLNDKICIPIDQLIEKKIYSLKIYQTQDEKENRWIDLRSLLLPWIPTVPRHFI